MLNRKVVIVVLGVLVIIVLAAVGFVTPGYLRYEYKDMNMGIFGAQQIRTDRFTGRTQMYGAGRWQPIDITDGKVHLPKGTTIEVK